MKSKNKVLSGTIWTAGGGVVQAIIQILRLSILARFLDKSDFGLVAIVVLILGFTQIFTDLGTSVSLFSRHDVTRKEYSSLYWVSLLLSLLLYGVLCAFSSTIANFYNMPQLSTLIPIMGLDLIISTAGRQYRVFIQKALKFKLLAIIDIVTSTFSLALALWIAMEGGGVWSLIYSTLFASLSASILLLLVGLRLHPLSFYINLKEGKSFYKVGMYQTGSQILDYIASQIDVLLIGKLMGASELGVYNLVKQLIVRVYSLLNPIISRVSIPILANLNSDPEILKTNYLLMLRLTSFINFAIYGCLALLAEEVLSVMYGPQYVESSIILQVFCIWGAITSVMSSASSIIVVLGRTDLGFKWTIIRIITNPIFVIIGYQFGFIGIVVSQAIYSLIFYPIYWKIVIKNILSQLALREYIYSAFPFMVYTVAIYLTTSSLKRLLAPSITYNSVNIVLWSCCFMLLYLLLNKKMILTIYNKKNKAVY